MLTLLRPTVLPTLRLSHPSHQLAPFSALADASNVPAGQTTPSNCPPLDATYFSKPAETPAVDTQRFPLLTQPLPAFDILRYMRNNDVTILDKSPEFTASLPSVAPTPLPLSSSFPVIGPFDLLYCVQEGGFGSAWAARDRGTDRLICLKVFQTLQDPDVKRSVQTELRVFRRMVKSQGGERGRQFIMELNRSIQHHATVYFAMELTCVDLGTYLCMEPERCKLLARQWMAQIALGIDSLHEMGILHRDIKSENILIDSRENVRIIDFGLSYMNSTAKPLRRGGEYAIQFLGTPPYMAPEVLENKGAPYHRRRLYGTAVDWWALGCILFELESWDHRVLFDTEEDVYAYIDWAQESNQPGRIYPKFDGLDPAVLSLIQGLLQVQPSLRFSLSDLEKHEYFWHCDRSEFENAAARALEKPVHPGLEPHFEDEHKPIEVVEAAKLNSIYDWTNLKCAGPMLSD